MMAASVGLPVAAQVVSAPPVAPVNLLRDPARWPSAASVADPQSWQHDGAAATIVVNAPVGPSPVEFACQAPLTLAGARLRWEISIDQPLSGAMAGIAFEGVVTADGQPLLVAVEPERPSLTLGSQRVPLPAGVGDESRWELLVAFSPQDVQVSRGGKLLAKAPVRMTAEAATLRLQANGCSAKFTHLSLAAPRPLGKNPRLASWQVTVVPTRMTRLLSSWSEYFGTFYVTYESVDRREFRSVREYGGSNYRFPDAASGYNPATAERPGPFSKQPVRVCLDDYRCWDRPDGKGFGALLPDIVKSELDVIQMAPVSGRGTTFDRDLVYWFLRDVYGSQTVADKRVFFQWGNEVNGKHLGTDYAHRDDEAYAKTQGTTMWKYYNLPEDAEAYVENYFAPAIEATRQASQDVYGDPQRIPMMLGSMANIYNPDFRQWMYSILDRPILGAQAPTLKGQMVIEHVDYLTVHYPFARNNGMQAMQEIWDRYGKPGRIKGLWITEDHGDMGEGPVTIVDRGLRYLAWAAQNQLTAEQTRLCWWGATEAKPGGKAVEAIELVSRFLADGSLRVGIVEQPGADLCIITASSDDRAAPHRVLVGVFPDPENPAGVDDLAISLPAATGRLPWTVRAVQYSAKEPSVAWTPTSTTIGTRLKVELDGLIAEPLLLLFEAAPKSAPATAKNSAAVGGR